MANVQLPTGKTGNMGNKAGEKRGEHGNVNAATNKTQDTDSAEFLISKKASLRPSMSFVKVSLRNQFYFVLFFP